jgi:hypothetical protein
LATLLLVQRALTAQDEIVPMALAGLALGLSVLIRPVSLLALPAVLLWLWLSRPFGADERSSNLRAALGFGSAFLVGTAPRFLLNLAQNANTLPWGPAEAHQLGVRVLSSPFNFLLSLGATIWQYLAADDVERLSAVSGSWQIGDWGSMIGAMIALAPTGLKLLGFAGVLLLCLLDRFESGLDRGRLPAFFLLLLILGSALALVDERSLLAVEALLTIFAFASLPNLVPGALGGVLGLGLIGLMVFHLIGIGPSQRTASGYRASDLVAAELQTQGAVANQVMSANWSFYDTRSPWHERYRHIPPFVGNADDLVREMKREGVKFLVFDRQTGATQWPQLASLMETERPRPGLQALRSPLRTDESPPNSIAIYRLE